MSTRGPLLIAVATATLFLPSLVGASPIAFDQIEGPRELSQYEISTFRHDITTEGYDPGIDRLESANLEIIVEDNRYVVYGVDLMENPLQIRVGRGIVTVGDVAEFAEDGYLPVTVFNPSQGTITVSTHLRGEFSDLMPNPEPTTLLSLGLGLGAVGAASALRRRRRGKRQEEPSQSA